MKGSIGLLGVLSVSSFNEEGRQGLKQYILWHNRFLLIVRIVRGVVRVNL